MNAIVNWHYSRVAYLEWSEDAFLEEAAATGRELAVAADIRQVLGPVEQPLDVALH